MQSFLSTSRIQSLDVSKVWGNQVADMSHLNTLLQRRSFLVVILMLDYRNSQEVIVSEMHPMTWRRPSTHLLTLGWFTHGTLFYSVIFKVRVFRLVEYDPYLTAGFKGLFDDSGNICLIDPQSHTWDNLLGVDIVCWHDTPQWHHRSA